VSSRKSHPTKLQRGAPGVEKKVCVRSGFVFRYQRL
jgi:hypothetical protein